MDSVFSFVTQTRQMPLKHQIEAQRSGFDLERRSDGVNERWRKKNAVANDTKSATTWYGRQDLNLHGNPLEPKSNVSANSTTPALC